MRNLNSVAWLLVVSSGLALPALADDEAAKKAPVVQNPSFERIKGMAGDWVQANGDGSSGATFKVTSNGSLVIETMATGTPYEMVNVYYLEDNDLVMTHFCAMKNQPHMKEEKSEQGDQIVFAFAGGTSFDPKKDLYMHDLTMKFVDADTVRMEWTSYKNGNKGEVDTFEYKRKK